MKLALLMIHCTATPQGREVTKEELEQWHMGPRVNADGTVTYLGKKFQPGKLPNDKIGGVPISKLKGNGWSRLGYSDMIHIDGTLENLTPFNQDDEVQDDEKTWGCAGKNSVARHIVLVGGTDKKGNAKDTRTAAQIETLRIYLPYVTIRHPQVQICGHNQFASKACPSFDVPRFMRKIEMKEHFIYS